MGRAIKKAAVAQPNKQVRLESIQEEKQPTFWKSTLFYDVYLSIDVPRLYKELWNLEEAGPFNEFLEQFKNLCHSLKDEDFSSWSERNTINRIIKPVLDSLGYTGTPKPWSEDESFTIKEKGESKTYKPDLIIVNDSKELKHIEKKEGKEKLEQARLDVIIPIEAKYWGRIEEWQSRIPENLKRADKKQVDSTRAMDFDEQCLKYMEILKKDYGILTDGKIWRLYNLEISSDNPTRFFQFNLGHLIKHVNAGLNDENDNRIFIDNAKYFFNFFSKQAHYIEPGKKRFLDELLEHTKTYVDGVGENLKKRFVEAMGYACNGFFRAAKEFHQETSLNTIRDVAESQLFNMLFIRYCESKQILPLRLPDYRKISISNTIDKLRDYDPEKENELNLLALTRMFSKDFPYNPKGTELYERSLHLMENGFKYDPNKTELYEQGWSLTKKVRYGDKKLGIFGFKESVFTEAEWSLAQKIKLTNEEMVKILFELGYCTSEISGRKYQQIPYNIFPPRELGTIYESFLEFRLEVAKEDMAFIKNQWVPANLTSEKIRNMDVPKVKRGKLFFSPNNEDRKATGTYYTPHYIVKFIVNETLVTLVKGKSSQEILQLKVCDPAMGSGHFLNEALNYLSRCYLVALEKETHDDLNTGLREIKKKILHHCIYGVDINPRAVKLAKMNLWLESVNSGEPLEYLDDQLKFGDSLVDDLDEYDKNFDWEKEFKRIKFDAVIGNPPWVSILGKHKARSVEKKYSSHLVSKYQIDTNRPNFYEAFVRKALDIISKKENARYGVILPEGFGKNEQFLPLRKIILDTFDLCLVGYDFKFPEITMPTGIFVIENSRRRKNFIGIIYPDVRSEIPFSQLKSDPFYSFRINVENFQCPTMKLVKDGLCKSFTGFIAAKRCLMTAIGEGLSQVLKGRDIQPFSKVSGHYIRLSHENLIGGTQNPVILHENPKILLRKTGAQLIAFLDTEGIPIEQSLYGLYDFKDIEPELLVCFLNSSSATKYYLSNLVTNLSTTPQLKKMHLDQFPIPVKGLKEKKKELMKLYTKISKEGYLEYLQNELDSIIDSIIAPPK